MYYDISVSLVLLVRISHNIERHVNRSTCVSKSVFDLCMENTLNYLNPYPAIFGHVFYVTESVEQNQPPQCAV